MKLMTNKRLWHAIMGDLTRQYRYQIFAAAAAITIIYILILFFLPGASQDKVVQFLIFNDPVALGMLFSGAMFLFEKNENTLEALSVTPLKSKEYLTSKVVTFSFIALAASLCMAFAAWSWDFSKASLILGVSLTASLFTMLGLGLVAGIQNFNEYVIKMGMYMLPVALPFLNFFEIMNSYWFYLIPTQASLLLLEASRTPITEWQFIYAILYLLIWNVLAYYWALKRLKEKVAFV